MSSKFAKRDSGQGWWGAALKQRVVWSRAAIIGFPIGCLQALINQGDIWWHHQADAVVVIKTLVSPLVTFAVALVSAAGSWVEKQKSSQS